jgi:hypothetical protein
MQFFGGFRLRVGNATDDPCEWRRPFVNPQSRDHQRAYNGKGERAHDAGSSQLQELGD